MHGGQICAVRGMHGRGCAFQGACVAGGVLHGRGHAWQGAMHVWQGACIAGGHACVAGGMYVWQGACMCGREVCVVGCMHGRRDSHCSGWYASYWNAFLFKISLQTILIIILIPSCRK